MFALDLVRVIFYGLKKKKTITPLKANRKKKTKTEQKTIIIIKKNNYNKKVSCSWREHYTEPKLQVVTVIN